MAEARIRVGVVGCGLIAQVMHLPYLAELDERFELAAVCDLSPAVAAACARRFGAGRALSSFDDLLELPLDLVMVLTGGSHAEAGIAAAEAGRHVFVEKPMALSPAAGARLVDAARRAGVVLMVGTMKRYDPAYERLQELAAGLEDVRLARVTTLESPLAPYVQHYPLVRDQLPAGLLERLQAEDAAQVEAALPDADAETRWCYRWILLDNLVHELNMLRGVLGEPTRLASADLDRRVAGVRLEFGDVACHLSWVDLPGIARYRQELALYAPDARLSLRLPSPFLRSAPSELVVEGGEPGTAHSFERVEVVAYEEAFKRELIELHRCIAQGREPRTAGADALHDLALCAAIVRSHVEREPVDHPSAIDAALAAPGG
jgi:predicted dehydrogenase